MVSQPTVISLFSGCGGSSLGYKWAGYRELLAIDFDQNSVDTFRLNFPDVPCWQRDIREVTGQEILDFCKIKKGDLDLLDGSPPCQGFSTAGKRKVTDPRNDLFREYVRLINDLGPKVFVMENVSGMAKGTMKGIFNEVLKELRGCGYQVKCKLMNAKWYGVPQSRERVIFIGAKDGEPSFPKPGRSVISVKEALSGVENKTFLRPNEKYISDMQALKPGNNLSKIKKGSFYSYVKAPKNKPSMTITKSVSFGKISMWHYEESRNITIEEAKRLCSFPDDFKMIGNYSTQWARIGNAVMPRFMYHIAKNIKENILKENTRES